MCFVYVRGVKESFVISIYIIEVIPKGNKTEFKMEIEWLWI